MNQSTEVSHDTAADAQMLKNISYVGLLVVITACVIGYVAGSIG